MPGAGDIYNSSMIVFNDDLRSLVPGIIPTQQDSLLPRDEHDRLGFWLRMDAFGRKVVRLYAAMRVWLAIFRALLKIYMKLEGTNLQFPWRARTNFKRYVSPARFGATRSQVIAVIISTAFDRQIFEYCLVR
jgi:hypothetical protein